MFLAFGTAIFKPGVQGLIANQMPQQAASLGWGMFYQMVNIGGFIGPLVRRLSARHRVGLRIPGLCGRDRA